jgi:hypothetical protein
MDTFKIIVKFFAVSDDLPHDTIAPIFHQWIREHRLADHLLIDVADYAHVVNGPGTLLISSEANISLDHGQGRLGLMYARKLPLPGTFSQRVAAALSTAAGIAAMLEREPALQGRLKFIGNEAEIRLNDRLAAPNTEASFEDARSDIVAAAREVWGADVTVSRIPQPLGLLTIHVTASASPDALPHSETVAVAQR